MESFIDNKNSLIWAFNENIDADTTFNGNTNENSLTQTKQITLFRGINRWRNYVTLKLFDSYVQDTAEID